MIITSEINGTHPIVISSSLFIPSTIVIVFIFPWSNPTRIAFVLFIYIAFLLIPFTRVAIVIIIVAVVVVRHGSGGENRK